MLGGFGGGSWRRLLLASLAALAGLAREVLLCFAPRSPKATDFSCMVHSTKHLLFSYLSFQQTAQRRMDVSSGIHPRFDGQGTDGMDGDFPLRRLGWDGQGRTYFFLSEFGFGSGLGQRADM